MAGRTLRQARKAGIPPPGVPSNPGDAGALPHEAISDPPSPLATEAMAQGGLPVVRGQSARQDLSPKGAETVQGTAQALASLGGPDQIVSSDAARTQETGQAISQASPSHPPVQTDPRLESHALGNVEGEPKSPDVKKLLSDLVRKYPDFKIPGQGSMSTRPGESFNEARVRILSAIRSLMERLAQNPMQSIAVPVHSQVMKFIEGWKAKGFPDDLSVDSKAFLRETSPLPGSILKFAPGPNDWTLSPFKPEKESSLPKGAIYFVEHGETPSTTAANASSGQRARAQIIAHIRSGGPGNFGRARKVGMEAISKGHLKDQDVEDAIDEALPSGQEARDLPSSDLLAAATMASERKRAELLPALQERFSPQALSQLPPHASDALRSHLASIGAGQ